MPDRGNTAVALDAPTRVCKEKAAPEQTEIITLGCRLNAYESEVMRQHAGAAGLGKAVIVNTCAVTNEAVRSAKQTIRRVRRDQPGAKIIVTGCAAQIDPDGFAELDAVDHVIGNAEKMHAATFADLAKADTERVVVNDIMSVRETAGHIIDGFGTRARAYVQVQNGCDHRCTFCIIPFGRGPSRSVAAGDAVRQIRNLVEKGFREVVLTGVDITSWGHDLPGEPKLGRLVRQILRHVPDLERLRLSSIDQVEADADLMAALADEERLMPHLHLSMQAGDDMILKRMKRRHSRRDAENFCAEARRLRPDVVFGADLIAGFPTETEAMFDNTLRLVDDVGLTYLHVFPFSPRKGTPAARMPQLERGLIKERARRLRAVGAMAHGHYLDAQIGRTFACLAENPLQGRTPHFAEVHFDAPQETGDIVGMRVTARDGDKLLGQRIA